MDPGSPESSDFMVDIVPQFAAISPENECQDIVTKDQVLYDSVETKLASIPSRGDCDLKVKFPDQL